MSRFVDNIITYRILKKLITPFEKTDAYRLGIIDKNGNPLKKDSELHTPEQWDSYTMLDRLIFRIKRIMQRNPTDKNRLANLTTALTLVREHLTDTTEYMYLESDWPRVLPNPELSEEIAGILKGQNMLSFKMFTEDYERPDHYPDGTHIPDALPALYQNAHNAMVPKGQNCANCSYMKEGHCSLWKGAAVKANYWCAKWKGNIKEDGVAIPNAVGGGFSGQATPNANPNLAGRDIIQARMARRKMPQLVGLKTKK